MSYVVLARKYRPQNFSEVIGQSHITEILEKAVSSGRISHAYLLCGPRGIGKTSCARILAKSLNCQKGPTLKPCEQCSACREISQGGSFDVLEIDGASNRGIDEIRTLRENVKFAPSFGKYKIYIVDEVHMLTTEAFNALLKTLEEPPEHVLFIFATTDPNKIPPTIISRCQRYDFKRISLPTIMDSLNDICQKEGILIEPDAVAAIAKSAQGSFRDALSVLDQISALSDRGIKGEDVYAMLGLVEVELLFQLTHALSGKDCSAAFDLLDHIIEKGKDIKQLNRDLVEHFRNLMMMKIGGKTLGKLIDYPIAVKDMYLNQAQHYALPQILRAMDLLIEAQDVARIMESLRTPLEIAFARMVNEGQMSSASDSRMDTALPVNPSFMPSSSMAVKKSAETKISPTAKDVFPQSTPKSKTSSDDRTRMETTTLTAVAALKQLDLSAVQGSWSGLTHAVSRRKMSVATFLQEGTPVAVEGDVLMIAFPPDKAFYKESLEDKDLVKLVEEVFQTQLETPVFIKYKIVSGQEVPAHEEGSPIVQSALQTFQGKIVSKWHND
jgi:DNA polymerase-3 subunit gamma/tau